MNGGWDNETILELVAINSYLLEALGKIADFCNGYGNEAGLACRIAQEAISKAKDRIP